MFCLDIVNSDAFLDMPLSAQALYFHLGMRADDDGFIGNPKSIQRLAGASQDDLMLLITKRFLIAFDSGVIAIKHWRMNNYIQKTAISKNLLWEYRDGDNVLEITINLSKPEKDNKDIMKLAKAPVDGEKYPKCALCPENEGYLGSYTHPPRSNLRTVSLTLGGEGWSLQYSPYAYFNEHCIVFNKHHTPMQMTRQTITKLFDLYPQRCNDCG